MAIHIPSDGSIVAFAMIVDINGFTRFVDRSHGNLISQYVGDVLSGAIEAVEKNDGEVVGFMGDAILGVLPSAQSVFGCCIDIAKDVDDQCEYISGLQANSPEIFDFAPGGPSLKIGVEYGFLDVSPIASRFLGEQKLLIGGAINYAARILSGGGGNRCLIGPNAAAQGLNTFSLTPHTIAAKDGQYLAYELDLSDVWQTGESDETFLG